MIDHRSAIQDLLERASVLEASPTQVALLEEAVRLSDEHRDVEAGFHTRLELIDAAMAAGQPQVLLVAFSWCLAQSDRDPETFSPEPLLWKHRWVVFSLPLFPQVSRQQIATSLEEITERYRNAGSTLRAIHLLRRNVAVRMGDHQRADEAHEAYCSSPRDWLSDGPENEQDFLVEYLTFSGQDEQALAAAQPLLTGPFRRRYEPVSTYPELLPPLMRLGRPEQALEYHRRGWKLLADKAVEHNLTEYADHLTFLSLTDNWPRGLRIVQRVLPTALATASQALRFDFFLACHFFFDRLAQNGSAANPGGTVPLRLPKAFPLYDAGRTYEPQKLANWFGQQVGELAALFDNRNGNSFFRERIDAWQTIQKLAVPCLLPEKKQGEEPGAERASG